MNIDRRALMRGAALASASSLFSLSRSAGAAKSDPNGWRIFEVTTSVEALSPAGAAKAWIPLPSVHAAEWIKPLDDHWKIEGGHAERVKVGPYGATLLAAEWSASVEHPTIEVVSRVATRDRAIDLTKPRAGVALDADSRKLFTAPTRWIPTDGIVRETAQRIVGDAKTDMEKAKRLYVWLSANTYRNPATRGCGQGDIAQMLRSGDLGGKCADINGLFVGLARAVDLPARDLYGVRVAASRRGYKSLGANAQVITKSQHCRAEVHVAGFGWVPVDPADVRKFVLEEPPGHLPVDSAAVASTQQFLFGAWETNWIAWNQAHDVKLPGAKDPELAFLMYPQVETAAGHRDCLDPDACRYSITAREILA